MALTLLQNPTTGQKVYADPSTADYSGYLRGGFAPVSSTPTSPTPSPTPSPAPTAPTPTYQAPQTAPTTYQAPTTTQTTTPSSTPVSSPTSPAPTQTQLYSKAASYTGPSIVDFLTTAGQPSDFASRTKLASQYGIQNYTGTAAQNTQLLGLLKSMATGATSPLGVPTNIAQTLGTNTNLPTPNAPIDTANLGGYGDLSKILGANLPAGTVSSDIAGLLSLYGASSADQAGYDKLTGQLTDLMGKLGQEGADLQAEMDKNGVGAAYQQVKELNLKAAQLQGELGKFDAETLAQSSQIEDQAIPTGLITGQQAQYQKQRDLTRIGKAAELSATLALSQAYQGNAQLGLELASKAVDLKYQPILSQIEVLKAQIGFAGEKLSKSDAARSKVIEALLNIKTAEINQEKQTQKDIQALAIQAASNGAPSSVIAAMRAATDAAAAAQAGGAYLKGNLESIVKAGTSGTGTGVKPVFTQTQLNGGASRSGLSLADFKSLDGDVQNFFVNNIKQAAQFSADLQAIASGNKNPQEVVSLINTSSLPQTVKTYLAQKIQSVAPSGGTSGGGVLSQVGNFFSSAWSGVKSLLGF